jgi:predicted 3-demethylubiquinone-9 3-methyltransferase (glyoxalase superfamily)
MADITTFLTFDDRAEEAVRLYLSIFEHGKITTTMRQGDKVFSLAFELFGKPFVAMNGGPTFSFSQGVSLLVTCDTQAEIDRYYDRLLEGGGKEMQCGWLADKFGVVWQIVPRVLVDLIGDKDPAKAGRAVQAMMAMKKLDIAALKKAHAGA